MERVINVTFTHGNVVVTLGLTGDGVDENVATYDLKADRIMRSIAASVFLDLVPLVTLVVSEQERPAGTTSHTVAIDPILHDTITGDFSVSVTLDVDVSVDELNLEEVIRSCVTDKVVQLIESTLIPDLGSVIGSLMAALAGAGINMDLGVLVGEGVDPNDNLGGVQIIDLGALLGSGIFGASGDDLDPSDNLCPGCGTDHTDPAASMAGLYSRLTGNDGTDGSADPTTNPSDEVADFNAGFAETYGGPVPSSTS